MSNKKKIIFFGTPNIGAKCLEAILKKTNYDIEFVVTQPDKVIGRKKEIIFSPVKNFCIKNNIKVYQPNKISELENLIKEASPDLILTCAYGQFVPSSILKIPKYKCINVHASLLPKYRGGAPIHWAIINGEEWTGISLMYMEKEMDSGNIIYQEKIKINFGDNLETLFNKMEELAYQVVFSQIDNLFNANLYSIPQDLSKVTFGYNIKREDEKINWNKTSLEIYNLIRGLSPKPGSYTVLENKIVKIYEAKILNEKTNNKFPGEIISINKNGIIVATLDNDLLFSSIQFEGKKNINNIEIYNNRINLENKKFI